MVAALVIAIARPVNGNSIQDTFRWTSAIETLRSACWFDGISMPDVVGKSNVSVAFCSMTNDEWSGAPTLATTLREIVSVSFQPRMAEWETKNRAK